MIKTHFQLGKDGKPAGGADKNGTRGVRLSNSAGKCDVRAGSARGMCNNIPLAGCSAGTRALARNRTINRKFPRANDFLRVCAQRAMRFAERPRTHVAHALSTMSRDKHPFCLLKINGLAASTSAFYKTRLKRARR